MVVSEVMQKFCIPFLGILLLTQPQLTFGNVISTREPNNVDKSTQLKTNSSGADIAFLNTTNIEPSLLFSYIEIYIHSDGNDNVECKKTLPKEHFEKFEKLGIFTYEQLTTFADFIVNELKNFFAKVAEEGSSQLSLNEPLEHFKKLEKDAANLANVNNTFLKFVTIGEAIKLLDQYNLTKVKNPTKEVELVADLLKKANWETVEVRCDEMVKKLEDSFISRAEEYKKSLTPEERTNDKTFDDWFTKFQNEQNITKKINSLDEFFELYCLPNEELSLNLFRS